MTTVDLMPWIGPGGVVALAATIGGGFVGRPRFVRLLCREQDPRIARAGSPGAPAPRYYAAPADDYP